jgi:nicotinate-nucleotide--dimethylbenzimidazole phosphoribosyltransferase
MSVSLNISAVPEADRPETGGAAVSLAEIRTLVVDELPPLPPVAATGESLGDFAALWRWLAASQQETIPEIRRPCVALFAAAHGAWPEKQAALPLALAELKEGRHAVAPLAREANADLKVYELDLSAPCADFRRGPALGGEEAAQAIAYGMMAVQPGIDLLLLAAINPVADLAAAEIMRALKAKMDPLDALLRFGGFDIAAMTGAIVAARLARIPVLLEGQAAQAAAAMLQALKSDAAAHAKNAAGILAEKTSLRPPCGGVMLIPLLKALTRAI